jgi:Lon protease-like protein
MSREEHSSSATGPDTATELPLFPLNMVLFPEGPLPLRIFEPRYVDLVKHCMRQRSSFGVLLIRAGSEAGSVASTADVGTSARIEDFYQLPDGLLGITCIGERKFRVKRRWSQSDGLNIGEIEWLETERAAELPAEYAHLGELVRKVLPELGDLYANMTMRPADASWVGSRLAEILPISLLDKQHCLEIDDPAQRLAWLNPLIKRSEE